MSVIVRSSSGKVLLQDCLNMCLELCANSFVLFLGEYLLFCKGADSSIFPRVVSGKVEQVKARVEQNAVVSGQFGLFLDVIWLFYFFN